MSESERYPNGRGHYRTNISLSALTLLAKSREPVYAAQIAMALRNGKSGPSPITVSRVMVGFAQNGLVTREKVDRTFVYEITEKGRTQLAKWGVDEEALLPEERINQFNEALALIGFEAGEHVRWVGDLHSEWAMVPVDILDRLMQLAIKGSVR